MKVQLEIEQYYTQDKIVFAIECTSEDVAYNFAEIVAGMMPSKEVISSKSGNLVDATWFPSTTVLVP